MGRRGDLVGPELRLTKMSVDGTLSTRIYAAPQGMRMRCQGTAFIMTRGPALVANDADQLLILLQTAGSVDTDYGGRRARREAGDVEIVDYARPFRSAATDYANLIIVVPRSSVPAALLALEPHGLIFPRGSGTARLIGGAMKQFYAQSWRDLMNQYHLKTGEAGPLLRHIGPMVT